VPYQYIGKQVAAVYDTDIVEIYYKHNRIAYHRRSYKKHDYTTTGEHMPAGHQHYTEQLGQTPTYFLELAASIGKNVYQYMDKVLKARMYTEQTFNACKGIIRLNRQYGSIRLEAACKRALAGNTYNYRTLQNILINHLEQEEQPEQNTVFKMPDHDNIQGPARYN
jgi:hypothetical protein